MRIESETERSTETVGLTGASYFPPNTIDNITFASHLEKHGVRTGHGRLFTAEGIFERTGILYRHLVNPLDKIPKPAEAFQKRETVIIEMAQKAACEALTKKGWQENDVDAVVFSTSVPYGRSPSKKLKSEMGLGPWVKGVDGDVIAECSSLTWAFKHMLEHKEVYRGKKVLYVASEWVSCLGAPTDPDRTLLSDGASALAFTYGDDIEVISTAAREFPEFAHLIKGPIQIEATDQDALIKFIGIPKTDKADDYEKMDGRGVFVWALSPNTLPPLISEAIRQLKDERPKIIIPHQANGRIIESMDKYVLNPTGLNDILAYNNIANHGNCGSVTMLNAFLEVTERGWNEDKARKHLQGNDIVLFVGFGAGMAAGASVIRVKGL